MHDYLEIIRSTRIFLGFLLREFHCGLSEVGRIYDGEIQGLFPGIAIDFKAPVSLRYIGLMTGAAPKNRLTKRRRCGIIKARRDAAALAVSPSKIARFYASRSGATGRLARFLGEEDHQNDDPHHDTQGMYPTIASH